MLVQTFIAQSALKISTNPLCMGFGEGNTRLLDCVLVDLRKDCVGCELSPVVPHDHAAPTPLTDDVIKFAGNAHAGQGRINDEHKVLAGKVARDG